MEKKSKEEYFKYYWPKQNQHHSNYIPRNHQKKPEHLRLLPHIPEEYHYRITNHLLVKKIMDPKRDKTIIQSLEVNRKTQTRSHSRKKIRKSYRKHTTLHHVQHHQTSSIVIPTQATIEQTCITKDEPQKIRKKILINRSQSTPNQDTNLSFPDNEFKIPQKPIVTLVNLPPSQSLQKKLKQNLQTHIKQSRIAQPITGIGNGSTVLKITDIVLKSNPTIKADTLMQLQLVSRSPFDRKYRNVIEKRGEKTIKSRPFKYCHIPNGTSQNQIKFGIQLSKIGDFIPLRIWKYSGVECVMMGTIDLPLNSIDDSQFPQKPSYRRQSSQQNPNLTRKVFLGELQRHLNTSKMHESETTINIKYKVYPKRFKQVIGNNFVNS